MAIRLAVNQTANILAPLRPLLSSRNDFRWTVRLCKLCWHNFEHNRQALAFENYAGIIGRMYQHYCSYMIALDFTHRFVNCKG